MTAFSPAFPRWTFWLAAALCFLSPPAWSEENDEAGYRAVRGAPFFVLTDTQYGSADNALLRVEIPTGEQAAVADYGGAEIRLYRVPEPLAFLRAQKNLHRVDVKARPGDQGLANTLSYLWSNLWNKSRRAWRELFTDSARVSVTRIAPALKTRVIDPEYRPASHFALLKGFEVVARFRYPLAQARPIALPEARLQGSSSEFLAKNDGNYHVPLGQLKPGLYLAEVIIGTHRASTLVFVSDTVAVTKIFSGGLTVWTAGRANGRPVAGVKLQWTDGQGTLMSAATDARGLARLAHASPERTYLLGEDRQGGVFVSENFYYDSEIHDTKLYAVTDRPLYRPGDEVGIKFFARDYRGANTSSPAKAGDVQIEVVDPNGAPVLLTGAALSPDQGAETAFRLPEDAVAGGYEIRMAYQDKRYGAAFRVAEYVKPHFEITLLPDRPSFRTGEPIAGRIRLSYPDGQPVRRAVIDLSLRAQALTMAQGELRYGGLFPVELSTRQFTSDDDGEAAFSLPPAREPSRLILTLLAADGAAYRVRHTRELLVERAVASWSLVADARFSLPGEPVGIRLVPENPAAEPALPATWEIVRLEDRQKTSGDFPPGEREWKPQFPGPGSYSLMLRDAEGNLLAATAHWVGGQGVEAVPGTLEIVTDRERYRAGEIADVLLTFSEPVDEALLTLERDEVHEALLLSEAWRPELWAAERLALNQWRVRVPIREDHAPNMTLSAVYVKHGEYVFQNAGLVVENPRIELSIKPDKPTAAPGEMVGVDIDATFEGKPVEAVLTVSVVDEMIYALQPEIAPDIVEFFQHVRRNNVRTGASLSFITYDEAADYAADARRQPPARHQYNERGVKVLERARRDEVDTAFWQPTLVTDKEGRANFRFRMPDALSRWRITVRAIALDAPQGGGVYGQRTAHLTSHQDFYAKWTSPDWARVGDAPRAQLALFNNTSGRRAVEVVLKQGGLVTRREVNLPRGVTYLPFELASFEGEDEARLEVLAGGKPVDALTTRLVAEPVGWRGTREVIVPLAGPRTALELPEDARRVRLSFAQGGSEHFLRIADSLLEYPWGCVEQTSSRLIPLAIATPLLSLSRAQGEGGRLWQTLYSQRLRLASLAGPDAVFGWWGSGTPENAFLSAYAYYADWHAARALGLELPAAHWQRLLEIYRQRAGSEPLLHRVLALWFSQQIGLPVRTQVEGVLAAFPETEEGGAVDGADGSPLMTDPDSPLGLAYARVLAAHLAKQAEVKTVAAFNTALSAAQFRLADSRLPSALSLLSLSGREGAGTPAQILAAVSTATPTLDRALALAWTQNALGGPNDAPAAAPVLQDAWQAAPARFFGRGEWRWTRKEPPRALEVEGAAAGMSAILRFDAAEPAESALPVTVERTLYRMEREKFDDGKGYYRYVELEPGEALSTGELYLDRISLRAREGSHRFGVVEVPLPPGASVERGTWGVMVNNEPLAGSRAEERRGVYGVPVEHLDGQAVTVSHLLRFAQTGRFLLPPARYYRMYRPGEKAYAEGGKAIWQVK
ncbi:MAG: alpha-2-macroglobulin family protein [Candidatus Accumulibacter sp.]|nr:alpha-2-macroglobulin family protein [Accumulibacter sp.]